MIAKLFNAKLGSEISKLVEEDLNCHNVKLFIFENEFVTDNGTVYDVKISYVRNDLKTAKRRNKNECMF